MQELFEAAVTIIDFERLPEPKNSQRGRVPIVADAPVLIRAAVEHLKAQMSLAVSMNDNDSISAIEWASTHLFDKTITDLEIELSIDEGSTNVTTLDLSKGAYTPSAPRSMLVPT